MESRKRNQVGRESHKSIKSLKTVRLERYKQLRQREIEVDLKIAELEKKGVNTDLRPQMQALHSYNEMKDLTQFVLGYLASVEQTTVVKLHERYSLPLE